MTDWRSQAACVGRTDLFFPMDGGMTNQARALCASCPSLHACFEYRVAHPELSGAWAGRSESEWFQPTARHKRGPNKSGRLCENDGCFRPHRAKGLCATCYEYERASRRRAS